MLDKQAFLPISLVMFLWLQNSATFCRMVYYLFADERQQRYSHTSAMLYTFVSSIVDQCQQLISERFLLVCLHIPEIMSTFAVTKENYQDEQDTYYTLQRTPHTHETR